MIEKPYADIGIHFGTKQQAEARLKNEKNKNYIAADLVMENPLVVHDDVFGERTSEEYLNDIIENAELNQEEIDYITRKFDALLDGKLEKSAIKSLSEKLSKNYSLDFRTDQDGIYVSMYITDDSGEKNYIPKADIIDVETLEKSLSKEDFAKLYSGEKISEAAKEAIRQSGFNLFVGIETEYLKLRNIEQSLKDLGYDGIVYPNKNEGEGVSYAVFDNEQIIRNETEDTEPSYQPENKFALRKDKGNTITKDMSEDERFEILKEKKLEIAPFDKKKADILKNFDIDSLKKAYMKQAKPVIDKIAEQFGVVGRAYQNSDIDLEFEYSKNSLKESMKQQESNYDDFAKMLSVFDKVVENAVGIEVHGDRYKGTTREDKTLLNNYVLLSAFKDETSVVPVRLMVKEFKDKENKLYLTVSLNKIEDSVLTQAGTANSVHSNTLLPSSSISLTEFIGKVNSKDGDLLKYLPDKMLTEEQRISKAEALKRQEKKLDDRD